MATKKIPIAKLTCGMYITKLDISWIDSPFMYHHLMIKTQKQIDKLVKAGVKQISIDTSKGKDVANDETDHAVSQAANDSCKSQGQQNSALNAPNERLLAPEKFSHPVNGRSKSVRLDKEIEVATKLKGAVIKLAGKINEALKNEEAVSAKEVTPLIDGTLESLKRNNQALATLINIQSKDISLANHSFATFSLVLSLSLRLELNAKDQQALAQAAFFHDAGWLKLPLNLLGKSSTYSASEKKLVQQHVAVGLKTLSKSCDLDDLAMLVISQHHELGDGSGFPKGLNLESMHRLSKIFSVVVRYDEMVQGLQDKPAMTPHAVLATLYKEAKAGLHDEKIVSELITLMSVYPVGSAVQLSNKEKGVVVDVNPDQPKQPVVKVYYDVSGTAHASPVQLDLSKQKSERVVAVVSVLDRHCHTTDPAGLF